MKKSQPKPGRIMDSHELEIQKRIKDYQAAKMNGSLENPKKTWWFRISKKRWLEDWKGLRAVQRSIMLTLWLYAGKKTDCFPSERKLSADLGINLSTVWKNIKILERKEFVRIEKKVGQKGKYHHYFLLK